MAFRFEKLRIWHYARQFVVKTYKVTATFPKEERFSLTDQVRRAATSIVLNIAEGSDRKSDKEFIRFLRISCGSVDEVVAAFYISLDLDYVKKDTFQDIYHDAEELNKMISAFIKTIKS